MVRAPGLNVAIKRGIKKPPGEPAVFGGFRTFV
jgi:hypothetical protein